MSKEYEEWLSGKILTYCEEFECAQAFEAGQQSQQAKIDELQDEIQGYKRIYGELELKRDQLNDDFRKVGMALATATKEAIIWMDKSKKSDFINQGLELKIDELQNQILLLKGWEKIAHSNGEKMREYCSDVILLQERINNVLQIISHSELHGDRSIWRLQEEIKEILRGIE